MGLQRPLPETDGLAGDYWKAASQGRLIIQRCTACGVHQHYGRVVCVACGAKNPPWVQAAGRGSILSFTVVQRSPYEDLAAPYVVALIRLEENVVMLSHVLTADPQRLRCDQAVLLRFQPLRDGLQLPVFQPVEEAT